MTEKVDQKIVCADCGKEFIWSATEQEKFAKLNYQPPKRCYVCRAKRRAERNQQRQSFGRR